MNTAKQRQEAFQLYNQITEGLEFAYQKQEIDDEQFSQLKIKTLAELEESLADLMQLKDTELIGFSNQNNMTNNYANFNMGTHFVPALLELIEADYETLEDGILDIQENTGLEDDQIDGMLSGELVPTPEMVDILNELFYATANSNENALGLQVLAALDRGDLKEDDLYDELEDDKGELEEPDEDEDDEETADEGEVDAKAVYSYIDPRVQELESKMADFELNSELKNRLNEVAEFARQGIEERWLSKAMYDLLLGSFEREDDRVAAFSQTAAENNVDLATQLYAVLFALKANEECGERVTFSSYVSAPQISAKKDDDELALLQIKKMVENSQLFSKN